MGTCYTTLYWTSQGTADILITNEIRRIGEKYSLSIDTSTTYLPNRKSINLVWSGLSLTLYTKKYIRNLLERISIECQDELKTHYNIIINYQIEILPLKTLANII